MSDQAQGPGWWIATDGKWYPPQPTEAESTLPTPAPAGDLSGAPSPGWWMASDGNWYPPQPIGDPAIPPAATDYSAPTAAPTGAPSDPAPPFVSAGSVPVDADAAAAGAGTAKANGSAKPLLLVIGAIAAVVVLLLGGMYFLNSRAKLADNGIPFGVDELPSKDVTLADGAVVVRSDGGNAIKEMSPDGTKIVLAAGAEGADKLQAGNSMILTGVTAVKVDKVERQGDQIIVTAKPTSITDVIKDGNMTFDQQSVELSKAVLRVFPPSPNLAREISMGPLAPDQTAPTYNDANIDGQSKALSPEETRSIFGGGESAGAPVDLPLAQAGGGSVSRSGELGGYRYTFNATAAGDNVTFTLNLTRDSNGFVIEVNVDASVSGVSFGGGMEISAASVRAFHLDAPNLRGKAKVSGSVAAGPQATSVPHVGLHIPMSIEVPFPIYGIPFTVAFEAYADIEVAFTSRDASVSGSFDATFDGSGNMSVNNGALNAGGAFNQNWEDPLAAVAGVSIAPAAVIIKVQFPKLSLGIGIALARASAYFEVVYAMSPIISGVTNFTPCRAESVAVTVKAGLTAEFLGHEIAAAERQIAQRAATPYDPPVRVCQI